MIEENHSISLYLHIPFCAHRCSYCDFNTYTRRGDLKRPYAAALAAEIAQVGRHRKRPCHTVFFGGGTPSLMAPGLLATILEAAATHFDVASHAEITMEANPGTVDEGYLTAVRALGVNRLSFGVQSVVASELALLERQHNFEDVVAAVTAARRAGFDDINLDLIYGVPGQTLASWQRSVGAVLDLQPTHLSLYCLTIEPGTPMQRWLTNGRFAPPDPDLAADQYEWAGEALAACGFEQYEISNWALPGRACRHNLTYWRNGEYLGLGAGAHGHAAGYRYEVVKQPRVYLRRMSQPTHEPFPLSAAVADAHLVTQQEAMTDVIITQLRLLREGLDLVAFARRFGQSLDAATGGMVQQLVDWGLVRVQGERLLLTQDGRFVSNQVFVRLMEALE